MLDKNEHTKLLSEMTLSTNRTSFTARRLPLRCRGFTSLNYAFIRRKDSPVVYPGVLVRAHPEPTSRLREILHRIERRVFCKYRVVIAGSWRFCIDPVSSFNWRGRFYIAEELRMYSCIQ